MKNKIRCHFDKINKFIQSEHFIDDVLPLITAAVVIFTVVFCSLLSPMNASAYGPNDDAFLIVIDNNSELILGTITDTNMTDNYSALYEMNVFVNSSTDNKSVEYYFNHSLDNSYPNGVNALNINGINYPLIYYGNNVDGTPKFYTDFSNVLPAYSEDFALDNAYVVILVYDETITTPTYMGGEIHLIFNYGSIGYNACNFNRVYDAVFSNGGSTPTDCPTLDEQISSYNGTWTEFLMMLRQNNHSLANSYQNNIDLAIQSGANSVTLEQRLSEFNGDWQDFERLMAEYNVDLQTMYTSYVNTLETQAFEDGRVFGNDEGYKNGYLIGLNKGQSDASLKSFFGDFINGCIDVIDGIHFYEEYDSNGELIFYLSPWSIVILLLMVVIVIILLKVWRGG